MANLIVRAINGLFDRDSGKLVSVIPDGVNDPTSVATVDFNKLTGGSVFSNGELTTSAAMSEAVPAKVGTVRAYAGDTQALVEWVPVDATSTYTIRSGSSVVGTAIAGKSNVTITGLTNGQAVSFTVTATNENGDGIASTASNSVTPSVGPVFGLPPLALWLDANQLALANGANVTTWADKSGNGFDAVNSGTGLTTYGAPTFLTGWANSKPAVAFSGSNQALNIKSLARYLSSKSTVFIVLDCTSLTNSGAQTNQQVLTNQRYVASPKWDDQAGFSISTVGGAFAVDSGGGLRSSSAAITLSAPQLASMNLPGNYFVNGTKRSNVVSGIGKSNANGISLGSNVNNGTLAYTGRIAEVIIYPVELTQAQRWAVEASLATKYGITVVQQ